MKIVHAFGSRACAIKMAPIIKEGMKRGHKNLIVWSGQHYDDNLYLGLFDDLEIPRPDYDIKARGSPLVMGAKILVEMEKILAKEKPDVVLVHGDTFTALYFALAGAFSLVPVGHVEAGLRTYSWEPFPEQICTKTADASSSLFFAATGKNKADLLAEHVPGDRIFVVGNSVVDAALDFASMAKKKSGIMDKFEGRLKSRPLIFWSVHRKENLLSEERMRGIFDSLLELTDATIFCSVLPSTQKAAEKFSYAEKIADAKHIIWEPCLPNYSDAIRIIMESDLVLTDSGGLQEETSSLHVPCLTLRYVTDRPESVESGGNKVVGCEKASIVAESSKIIKGGTEAKRMRSAKNPYGDGKASARIISTLEKFQGRMQRWETKVVKQ